MAAMLLLVKCYDIKKVESLDDLNIISLVGSRGGKPTKNYDRRENCDNRER